MAEKLVKNSVCEKCGAEVRLNALFCYNCGGQVASDEEVAAETQNGIKISDAWFKETIAEGQLAQTTVTEKRTTTAVAEKEDIQAIPKPTESLTNDTFTRTKNEPLKTAASLRNKQRPTQKKKVEVKWESHENAPNFWFLTVAIILVAFAIFILFAMLYIR